MRRHGGYYEGDSGGGDGGGRHEYGGSAAQMHHQRQQRNSTSGYYQEQQAICDKEIVPQHDNQWRWERDGAQDKLPQTAMSPTAPFSEGREAPRSYYQSQRLDQRMLLERQGGGGGGGDHRSQPHEEDMDVGYEDNRSMQNFEGLQQRFLDDIMKLSKEQTNAEDAENARHRERINAINSQYEEQLLGLRSQHASRRDDFIRRASQARQEQYQQMVSDPAAGSTGKPAHRPYNNSESYIEGSRFSGNARDLHRYDPKISHPKAREYESGSRYY